MTKRQKDYRRYLFTEHWKALRACAIDRDGGKCQRCHSTKRIQVHHLCYRGHWENTWLKDLETICRECHRKEHGFGPSEYESLYRTLEKKCNCHRKYATEDELRTLVGLVTTYDERKDCEGLIRMMAMCRMSRTQWESWIKKPTEITLRLFPWSARKFDRLSAITL